MSGWIKLHREINSHWIWTNSDYFKWWIDILLEVNHTPQKTLIKGVLFECNRGETLYSLDTWAKRWKTNKSKVRRFLELLQKDEMITLKNEKQTTRLTVCKYDSYQDERNANETQTKHKRNTSETQTTPIQECNNANNEKNEKNNIPAFHDFLAYAKEKEPSICERGLKLKYDSWIENDWKDGNNSKILNWKVKLLNTITFLPKVKKEIPLGYYLNNTGELKRRVS